MKDRILKKISANIQIDEINIINESYLHKGHVEGGGDDTHFRIEIKSKDFQGKTLIECHKMINKILKEEFDYNGLHALSIKVIKPPHDNYKL